MSAHLQKLIEHLKWADAAALEALRRSGGSDARTLMIYSHVLGAEAVWIARLAGRPSDVAVWPVLTLEQAASLAARNAAELDAFVARLTPDDLGREIDYRTSDGRAFRSTVEDILLHTALHGSYHRGQIALLIRADGGEPAPTDYIAFARGAPAARTTPPTPIA
ncbi:MAG TPA: DinB family protein [Gemmatimonadaceae bacterium]|nr:DinB family protein [Gemmatimonadaceae bacterium]